MREPVFRGAATALITPFKDRAVDYDAFGKIIDWQIESGIDALVVCGTSGEASTLVDEEHIATIAYAVERTAGRVPVIAGTGSNDTPHALKLCTAACEAGADALLVVTPYYNKTSQAGLIRLYTEIADAVERPLILYNVPSRTGMNIAPATCAALADHPNIAGIKEASGNISQISETASLIRGRMDLYSGNDDQITPIMALGGLGVISVLSNVLPAETARMCRLFAEGEVAEAARMQLELMPLIKALFSDVNPIPVKEAMAMMGWCASEVREPLVNMETGARERLRQCLLDAGVELAE